ncbi:hypothetical protein AVEN_260372-1 [Araneus ventricosus]|uniref:Transposase Tc1-like domain-containing protein n=1 Tax=Araneus ventricosus TaxID=182803 RepID=A0A4Y2TQN5_ARAVE|nr:hypothetical protein AVEN_260372-1 [Araneus ventricosus]
MVVVQCWQQWIEEGTVIRRNGSRRPWATNAREDLEIRRETTSTPTVSLSSIRRHLPVGMDPVVSRHTIRRRPGDSGLH